MSRARNIADTGDNNLDDIVVDGSGNVTITGTVTADDIAHPTAGSVGTDYVVNGSAKAYHQTDFSATATTRLSLNISSVSDGGSQHTCNFTNSFSGIYQVWTAGVGNGNTTTTIRGMHRITRSASAPVFIAQASNGSDQASEEDVNMLFHGDLA